MGRPWEYRNSRGFSRPWLVPFDFDFFSSEWPNYVCSNFNDAFTGPTADPPLYSSQPGEQFTLEFMIWDAGDGLLDSSALIDHFQWLGGQGQVTTPVTGPVQ